MRPLVKWSGVTIAGVVVLACVLLLLVRNAVIVRSKVVTEAVERSVDHRSWLLDKAFALPIASKYGRHTYYQTNGSFCGPASLVNVFRSQGEDPSDEAAVLRGTGKCSLGFCWMGLTLDELAEVARTHGPHRATVLRDLSPAAFREHLRRSNEPAFRYVVNFTRKKIFDAGGGHHSPIGGYLEAEDMVLVLDVNKDFGPWIVSRERLYAAVDTLDGGKKRGLLLIE